MRARYFCEGRWGEREWRVRCAQLLARATRACFSRPHARSHGRASLGSLWAMSTTPSRFLVFGLY